MEKIKFIKSDYLDNRNSLSSKSGITASSIDINHTHNNVIMINFQGNSKNKNTRIFGMLWFVSPRLLKLSLVTLISLKYNFDFCIYIFLFYSYHNTFCHLCCICKFPTETGELEVLRVSFLTERKKSFT